MRLIRTMFRPPTDYYCEAVEPIDEQLCALIAKRKEWSWVMIEGGEAAAVLLFKACEQ